MSKTQFFQMKNNQLASDHLFQSSSSKASNYTRSKGRSLVQKPSPKAPIRPSQISSGEQDAQLSEDDGSQVFIVPKSPMKLKFTPSQVSVKSSGRKGINLVKYTSGQDLKNQYQKKFITYKQIRTSEAQAKNHQKEKQNKKYITHNLGGAVATDERRREHEFNSKLAHASNKMAQYYTEARMQEPEQFEYYDGDQIYEVNSQNTREESFYFFSPERQMSHRSSNEQNEIEYHEYDQYENGMNEPTERSVYGIELPVVGCMPSCTRTTCGLQKCNHDYDYSKNYQNALNQRPGEFVEYNWMAANYHLLQQEKKGVVCEGIKQTPINLETSVPILETFEDKNFAFRYSDINPREQLKFNQKGQQYQLVMKNKTPNDNFMITSTIGLFDKCCDCAKLQGLQYHFHAPSEHSINGKLLDLEMHIVHGLVPNGKQETKFTNGVLGFFFKAVPDDFEFALQGLTDYHDRFLKRMLVDSQNSPGKPKKLLNLTKFVQELRYNRRWTYTGSLTTAPFSEGILWNVLEQVILIRQSTLDMFLEYRKIEEQTIFNQFQNEHEAQEVEAKLSIQPDQMKPFHTDDGESFFRVAACNRVVQDQGDRPVYHIDVDS